MYMYEHGATSTKELKENLDIISAAQLVNNNSLNWFERVSHGTYQLSPDFEFFRMKHFKKIKQITKQPPYNTTN